VSNFLGEKGINLFKGANSFMEKKTKLLQGTTSPKEELECLTRKYKG
jgi:hypothetical protein